MRRQDSRGSLGWNSCARDILWCAMMCVRVDLMGTDEFKKYLVKI
jgi:hypothetical protein